MEENKIRTVDDEIAYNNYKLTADKILQLLSQIREDPSASAKRWVWELLQNAKDVPNRFGKVSVEIELSSPDTLKFRHNGDAFTIKNITGLVQQVSSKDSQNLEGQTGKFGTGFICTHLLSDIIDVEGIVNYMDEYRRFSIPLDRSGYRSEDLLPRIESTLEELRHIKEKYPVVENYESTRTEQSFDTVFTYHLKTEEQLKSASAGLEDLINTLPVTLVTQSEKIKQVRVINQIIGTNVVYECDSESLGDNVRLSKVIIGDVTKTYLSYINKDVALTTEVSEMSGTYEIVKRDSKQPVLYRDFPLIGSEKFYFPYTLNGFDFNPTERRNGLLLNSADHPDSITNRQIVEKAVNAVLMFNEWLIKHHVTNRYLLASSRIPESPEKYSEDVAAPWIKNLQRNWRKQLLDEHLVETDEGVDILRNISIPTFSTIATKEINERFFNLLHGQYIGRGILPKFDHLHGWIDIIRPESEYDNWGTKLKYDKDDFLKDLSDLQNLSTLCAKISKNETESLQWLNRVYKFFVEQNLLADFDNFAIIPNQNGDFKFLKDLKSDHTSRIPEKLKSIYNSVNQDNATVQHILMNVDIDATVFGSTLQSFSLKEMIEKLNNYIKQGTNIYKNDELLDIKSEVAHGLLALYPNIENTAFIKKRYDIYEFCKAYRTMPDYCMVDVADTELWNEADNFWFNTSFANIANKTNVSSIAQTFFILPKTEEDTLIWLNKYIQFYRDNSHGDLIKEQTVFPTQQKKLKKLNDLRYDNAIPEVFKDLANHTVCDVAASPTDNAIDVFRDQLLHRAIHGYEHQNPLAVKDIYEFVKGKYDSSNDRTREIIARHTISILVKQDSEDPEEKKLYDFAKTISGYDFEDAKFVDSYTGFNWGFAQEYYIKLLANRIALSCNLDGFKALFSNFTEETTSQNIQELTTWIDSFIEFIYSYKTKKYWSIITDKENGIGIWLNQNNNFCKFQDVRKDDNISEDLKDICANNVHIKHDFREEMFTLNSSHSSYLETNPITLKEIGEFVDEQIKQYNGNKQDNDFRTLVFAIDKLCKSSVELKNIMTYFMGMRNSLIVWSLGEGATMDLVSSIVQQGDEKLEMVKNLLEDNSIDEINRLNQIVKGPSYENVKKIVEQLGDMDENTSLQILELAQCDKTQLSAIQEILKDYPSLDFNGILTKLKQEQGDFSTEQIQQNISDERKREIGDKGECYVYEMLCNRFSSTNVKWSNYAPTDEKARIVLFNGKEYRLNTTHHDFDFVVSNNDKTIFIEVKTTVGNIKSSKDFPLIFETKEWEWIDGNSTDNAQHYIVRVFDVENNPKAYFLKQELNVE